MRCARSLAGIATAFTLAGCGAMSAVTPGNPSGDAHRSAPERAQPPRSALAASRVPAQCPPARELTPPGGQKEGLAPLPRDFHPSTVLLCDVERAGKQDTTPWVMVKRRGDDGLARLVHALRQPSQRGSGGPCTLELTIVPWFALINARGEAFRPKIPTGECGKPRDEVLQALRDMRLEPVERPGRQTREG